MISIESSTARNLFKILRHDLRPTAAHRSIRLAEFLELAGSAWFSYRMGLPEQKCELVKRITSNQELNGKNVVVDLYSPFNEVVNCVSVLLAAC
jgi:hypothetical protein